MNEYSRLKQHTGLGMEEKAWSTCDEPWIDWMGWALQVWFQGWTKCLRATWAVYGDLAGATGSALAANPPTARKFQTA